MILADAMGAGLPKVVESYNFQTASLIQEAIAELYVRRWNLVISSLSRFLHVEEMLVTSDLK